MVAFLPYAYKNNVTKIKHFFCLWSFYFYGFIVHNDSCRNTDLSQTPTSKAGSKRLSNVEDVVGSVELESGSASTTKPSKLVRVKVEPTDKWSQISTYKHI